MIINFVLISVVTLLLYILFRRKPDSNSFFENLNGPLRLPIFGNAFYARDPMKKILLLTQTILKEYGSRARLELLGYKVILTNDYKLIEFLLSGQQVMRKSHNYFFLFQWLGRGLLISDGEIWRKHRKMITPTFHFEILKKFVPIFEAKADILIEKLQNFEDKNDVDVHPLMSLCTLDVICETAMGTKINAQSDNTSEYVSKVQQMCRIITERVVSVPQILDCTFACTPNYWRQKRALKVLHDYSNNVIQQKINNKENNEKLNGSLNEDPHERKKKNAFLDLLFHFYNNGLTQEELREEVDTFMFAGHDTTAAAISFALYNIAKYSKVQQKVYEEQIELFGKEKNPEINHEILNNMKYLEFVIKESLRLYPSVPFIGRCTEGEVKFEDQIIPKGTNIMMFMYSLHRNPEYFPNPEEFEPERFENANMIPPYAYIPFSAGPRNCIGQKFAMLEMKTILSKIVRNFELKPVPGHTLDLNFEVVLKSASGIRVGLTSRG